MKAPGKLAKALIFIAVCVALLAVFFVSVAGDRLLRSYETYYVEFENQSVDGLEVGGNVQYRGISVGNVREIEFSAENPDVILVEIAVEADIPVRSDVRASVAPVGISGISQLQLTGGSRDAPFLQPGERLSAETSLMSTLTGSAESVAGGIEELLEALIDVLGPENRDQFSALLGSLRGTVEEVRPGVATIVDNFEEVSFRAVDSMEGIDAATRDLRSIAGNLESTTSELRIGETMDGVESAVRSLQAIAGNLERTTSELRIGETVERIESAARSLQAITGNLEQGTAELQLADTAEALNRSVRNVDSVITRTGSTIDEIDLIVQENRYALTSSLRSFQRAMRSLSDVASQIDSDPSLLLRGRSGGSTIR